MTQGDLALGVGDWIGGLLRTPPTRPGRGDGTPRAEARIETTVGFSPVILFPPLVGGERRETVYCNR